MKESDSSKKIQKLKRHAKDVGSPEAQVVLLTGRLESLTGHFEKHPKDEHSRRGMMKMISRRKRLLSYLRVEDGDRYKAAISTLGLRK